MAYPMDLTCPVEFREAEVLYDSAGRAQVYLTLFNLSQDVVQSVYLMVTLLDADGSSLYVRPLRAASLAVAARSSFTIATAADNLEPFVSANVLVPEVAFAYAATWTVDDGAIVDCSTDDLTPGHDRTALLDVAGADAVCFPTRLDYAWVCVCGRYNLLDSTACIRCGRERDAAFTLTPEYVREAYAGLQEKSMDAHKVAMRKSAKPTNRRQRDFDRRMQRFHLRRTLTVSFILLLALVCFLFVRFMPFANTPSVFSDDASSTAALPSATMASVFATDAGE